MIETSPASRAFHVQGKSLETLSWRIGGAKETIVLIHEALGSATYWKNFPAELARSACCHVVAYSRAGHGDSDGPLEARSNNYYERQVDAVLPALMREFQITEPILYGHSEGAAIALLYAAANPSVKAIITESPIAVAVDQALETVEAMDRADGRGELIEKLGRYHRDANAVFESWVQGVRLYLSQRPPTAGHLRLVQCPVLVIQGVSDPFGGAEQWVAMEKAIPNIQRLVLAQSGHLPHREEPLAVIEAATRFLHQPRPSGRTLVHENCKKSLLA